MSRRADVPSTVSRQAQDYLRIHRAARLPIPLWPWVAKAARRRDIRARRPIVERLASTLGVQHSATDVGGVSCVEFRATDIVDERAVLHVHGGAYFLGEAFDIVAVQLAAALRRPVLSVEYTTVPDATVTTSIDECMAVYRRVADHHAPYALSGKSAGGGLVLAMYHAIQTQLRTRCQCCAQGKDARRRAHPDAARKRNRRAVRTYSHRARSVTY